VLTADGSPWQIWGTPSDSPLADSQRSNYGTHMHFPQSLGTPTSL
jgi:hypothetical protein